MTTGGFEDRAAAFLEEHWKPLTAGVLGFLALLVAIAAGSSVFGLLGLGLLVAAVVMAVQHAFPSAPVAPAPVSTVPVPDAVRQDALQQYLSQDIAVSRGRIESVAPYSAVVVTGQKVNHVLHLLVSVLLCGLWLPVWLLVSVSGGEKRHVLTVDRCGNVTRR